MKNRIALFALLLLTISAITSGCSKDDQVSPPSIALDAVVDGTKVPDDGKAINAAVGTRIDYTFRIRANATIATVKTIYSMIINDEVKTVEETLTGGFTNKLEDEVKGTMFAETIGREIKIIVTDTQGNEAQKAVTVIPEF